MNILWVNPSFLDYRIPVYTELDRIANGGLTIVFSTSRTPLRVVNKINAAMEGRSVGLEGERIFAIGKDDSGFANNTLKIPYQPNLLKEVIGRKVDVVIAEGFFQWTPVAMLKKIIQRTPLVLSYERTAHTERNCPVWRTVYRRICLRIIDAVICNGKLSKQYIESLGMPTEKIMTGGMAADSRDIKNKIAEISNTQKQFTRNRLKLKEPTFLYTGQIIARKGIAELLKGWGIYKEQKFGPGSLLLVGGGNQEEMMRKLVKDKDLPDVYFTGRVDYDNIIKYYAVADVFVMPTLEDNWSLVVPEAMACGLPIACSKYNGCWPELIKEGENGVVFDPFDSEVIAESLMFFVDHGNQLEAMGQRSQEIEESFSPVAAASAILEACKLAIGIKH